MYLHRLPKIVRAFLPGAVFEGRRASQASDTIYLTFDDGPVPGITSFVLDTLADYNAKATFFMVGENVAKNPDLYQRVLHENHGIGNHTYNHLKGTQTPAPEYLNNVRKAAQLIDSPLFRPPYGKISRSQARHLAKEGYQLVFWSLLSGDFDQSITPGQCLDNVLNNIRPNDIIVFHDSVKAEANLRYCLPKVLAYCQSMHWRMLPI